MEMNCEHGISIHHTCHECNQKYISSKSFWEANQIRRELGALELRLVDLSRERSAEFRRRLDAERLIEQLHDKLLFQPDPENTIGDYQSELMRMIVEWRKKRSQK